MPGAGSIKIRRHAAEANIPVLDPGEMAFALDTNNVWIGDGAANHQVNGAGGGGGAPTTADYLVKTANATLTAERVVTDTGSVTWDWGTAGQAKANVVDEYVQDMIGTFLVAGTGIGLSYNDAANTLTITNSAPDTVYTDEQAQDAVGTILTDSATIDFTYNDAANTITAAVLADSIDNTLLANMATARFKGRTTAGTGDPEDLTGTQATAMLDVATTALKGLAPASGGGTTNFLRADLTWAAPASGGGITAAFYKEPVRAASTVNVNIGTLGAGSVMDGVTLAANDRVLLKNQTTTTQNGIYVVGSPTVRAADADAAGEIPEGTLVYVQEGTAQADRIFQQVTAGNPTPGTNANDWLEVRRDSGPLSMTGATSSVAGTGGMAKAPNAGEQNRFLRGDGTWAGVQQLSANQGVADQGPGFAADTYLAGSSVSLPASGTVGGAKAGTRYKLRFFLSKTGAGIAAIVLTVRVGTAQSTADAARLTFTFNAQTGVIDEGTIDLFVTVNAVGAGTTGVIEGVAELRHRLTTTGLSTAGAVQALAVTSGGFDTTVANLFIGASLNGGASASFTVKCVQAEVENLNP